MSVAHSPWACVREASACPFAEQNGPQMAHGLLRWIAAFAASH